MIKGIDIDHIDIVTCHMCNKNCITCVDKFLHSSEDIIKLNDIEKFLRKVRKHTDKKLEVLLLGGEPTMLECETLIEIASIIKKYGFSPIMSTNGLNKDKIEKILPYYDWVQITVYNDRDIDYWRKFKDKVNVKLSGNKTLTMNKLQHFIEYTEGFDRRSVSMYFTPDFTELCTDKEIWNLLNDKEHTWVRNGSYEYMFYKGVRFKKCIHGETNIIDEPTVPKLYPNGNYNKTWTNENMDDYLED